MTLVTTTPAPAIEPLATPWLMPFDVGQKFPSDAKVDSPSQEQIYNFAWESFIALNWPYLSGGTGGQPNPDAPVIPIRNGDPNDPSPLVVWESYMVPGDLFPENPDPNNLPLWQAPDQIDVINGTRDLRPPTYSGQNGQVAQDPSAQPFFFPGINQPYTHANVPTGPVVDQKMNYLRYEVTMNQAYFNYVVHNKYFVADEQKEAVENYLAWAYANPTEAPPTTPPTTPFFQPVPNGTESYIPTESYAQQGLVEVKAAWRVLETDGKNPDIPERYFRRTMEMALPGGGTETKLVGLVGFHIHRVTPHGHLPSTFEHVDNVELVRRWRDPLPLPKTPSMNPGRQRNGWRTWRRYNYESFIASGGSKSWPPYPNGYEVQALAGQPGIIPMAFLYNDDTAPPIGDRVRVNVSRATPIPNAVRWINYQYQAKLKNSVWRYYQLIGTQNISGTNRYNPDPNLQDKINPKIGPGIPNNNLGPGIPGAQFSNTTDLINTTLESYTQPGFSCARCHINAFPHGVEAFPPYENAFKDLHVMSFVLLNAHFMNPPAP
jgi:hypothetical protein